MRVFILGAGATGGLLAQLLRQRGFPVSCGDRDPERARPFVGPHIECRPANARSLRSVVGAARGCDLIVNTAPAVFNETVIRAAVELGVHYLDMASHLERNPFKAEQLRFDADFVRCRRLALINAGAAPGLTNLLVAECAETFDEVDQVRIRLFENTESDTPISTWSADVAFDEAISKPRVYRGGQFRFARRFSQAEWFHFPRPIGKARLVLAAQDEVATLPRFIEMNDLDVKIGGNEINRLRRWYKQGKLRPSSERPKHHFPDTASPSEVADLIRNGKLRNARFVACVSVTGVKEGKTMEQQRCCLFPSLFQLRRHRISGTPIAFAAAESAGVFVENFPRYLSGVYPPEALSAKLRKSILSDMSRRGFRFQTKTRSKIIKKSHV